jgi:excisionase family DNA binding protein
MMATDRQGITELPLVFTVAQVQKLLKLSRPKAYALTQTQGFPALRFGKVIRVPREAFLRWLDAQTMHVD